MPRQFRATSLSNSESCTQPETLAAKSCELIIETHSKALESGCIQFLEGLGYQTRIIKNVWYRMIIPE